MTDPVHLVVAMGVVKDDQGRLLLIRHPIRGWEPPGGRIENGEDILTGLKREVFEESGFVVEVGRLLAVHSNIKSPGTIPPKVLFSFEATLVGGIATTSDESLEIGWFSVEEALRIISHPIQHHKLVLALRDSDRPAYSIFQSEPFTVFFEGNI